MKIQITDRELWLTKISQELRKIYDERDRRNAEYLALPWYIGIFRNNEWPSDYASYDIWQLENLQEALLSKGTGDIWITYDELRAVL